MKNIIAIYCKSSIYTYSTVISIWLYKYNCFIPIFVTILYGSSCCRSIFYFSLRNDTIFVGCPYNDICSLGSIIATNFYRNICSIIIDCSYSGFCSAFRTCLSESSSWNEGQHECCHGSQRYNLLRDLIQLYSLPINFTRSFACPHSGAGVAVRPSLASCGTRRPLPPCTSTTASAVASGTGRIIPAWRYAVAVFPLPIT